MVIARLARREGRTGGNMPFKNSTATLLIAIGAAALCAGALVSLEAQQPAPGGGGGGGVCGGAVLSVCAAADLNKDGFVTRDELKAAFARWLSDGDAGRTGSLTQEQLAAALTAAFPPPAPPAGASGWGVTVQKQDSKPGRCGKDDARLARQGAGQAQAASQGARPGQGCRLCALLHPAGGEDRGSAGRQDRSVDDHGHLRSGRHYREESEAVRSAIPRQHHRSVPGRRERCLRNGRPQEGVARIRQVRQGTGGDSRRRRFLS